MCGRFALTLPHDAIARIFEAVPANDLPDLPNYNICPTDRVHSVQLEDGQRRLTAMRWGFLPHWQKRETDGPLLINARAETVAGKPAFRSACRNRRCLIPASGFYEWTKDEEGKRLPWYIHPAEGDLLALAGIWQDWEREGVTLRTCAIVTTAANVTMSRIHHRMPVVIARHDWPLWLGEAGHGAASLMKAAEPDALAFFRVGTEVNSNRARGAQLIEPLPEVPQ